MRIVLPLILVLVACGLYLVLRDEGVERGGGARTTVAAEGAARDAVVGRSGSSVRVLVVGPDDEPVPGASISHEDDDPVTTDATGRCVLSVPHEPWLKLDVRHPDYVAAAAWVEASDPEETTIRLERGAPLTVVVLGPEKRPVAKAQVEVMRTVEHGVAGMWHHSDLERVARGTTDVRGRADLGSMPVERLSFRVDHAAYAPRTEALDVRDTAPIERVVVLDRGGAITGRVLGPDGAPVGVARVRLLEVERPVATAAVDGTYRLDGVGSDPVRVVAEADGFGPGYFGRLQGWDEPLPVSVQPGDLVSGVDIGLFEAAWVVGRVVDDRKEPVADLNVQLHVPWSVFDPPIARTGPDGRFRAGPAAIESASRCNLQLGDDDRPMRPGVSVKAGEEKDAGDIVYIRRGSVRGTVRIADGSPAAGAFVGAGYTMSSAATGADGAFVLDGLKPGPTRVMAWTRAARARPAFVHVLPGRTTEVDLTLHPLLPIAGRVVTPGGKPREGIVLGAVLVKAQEEPDHAWSDAEGSFRLGLPAGRYRVGILGNNSSYSSVGGQPPAFLEDPAPVDVDAGTEDLEFVFPHRGATITGRIVSRHSGLPLREFTANVLKYKLFIPGDWDLHHCTDGRLVYETDGPGTWQVEIAAQGHARHRTKAFSLETGERKDLGVIRIGIGGTLAGVVEDARGAPVPYARINILNRKFQTNPREPFTDRHGRFELERLSPGPYTVFAVTTGYPFGILPGVLVKEEEVTRARVVLADPAPLELTVVDRTGAPVEGVAFTFTFDAIKPLTSKLFRAKIPPGCGNHYSDENGLVRQLCLPTGAIGFTLEEEGFKTVQRTVDLKAGEINRVRVELERD